MQSNVDLLNPIVELLDRRALEDLQADEARLKELLTEM